MKLTTGEVDVEEARYGETLQKVQVYKDGEPFRTFSRLHENAMEPEDFKKMALNHVRALFGSEWAISRDQLQSAPD